MPFTTYVNTFLVKGSLAMVPDIFDVKLNDLIGFIVALIALKVRSDFYPLGLNHVGLNISYPDIATASFSQ